MFAAGTEKHGNMCSFLTRSFCRNRIISWSFFFGIILKWFFTSWNLRNFDFDFLFWIQEKNVKFTPANQAINRMSNQLNQSEEKTSRNYLVSTESPCKTRYGFIRRSLTADVADEAAGVVPGIKNLKILICFLIYYHVQAGKHNGRGHFFLSTQNYKNKLHIQVLHGLTRIFLAHDSFAARVTLTWKHRKTSC